MLNFDEYIDKINVGLIKTYDIDFVIEKSYMSLSVLNIPFDIEKKDSTIKLNLYHFNKVLINHLFGLLNNNFVNLFGWFPSFMFMENTVGMKNQMNYDENYLKNTYKYLENVSIIYESKFDKEVKKDKVYHISIQEYENKILKYGLIPKTKSKISSHGNRIYVCLEKKYCYELIERMKFYFFDKNDKINTKWVIYEIYLEKDTILYKDPNFLNKGCYMLGNISPDNIKIIDKEK